MLVLSRHRDEAIKIDLRQLIPLIEESPKKLISILQQPLQVLVVDIRGDKVRCGIEADRLIAVHRDEVFEAIERENQRRSFDAGR